MSVQVIVKDFSQNTEHSSKLATFGECRRSMERVIHRADLESEDGSSSSTSAPQEIDRLKRADHFDFIPNNLLEKDNPPADDAAAKDDETEFRLFAPSKTAGADQAGETIHRVRIRSPSLEAGEPRFLEPQRKSDYYFAKPLSAADTEKFQAAALTSEQVHSLSRTPWPGCAYSWKVLHLPASSDEIPKNNGVTSLSSKLLGNALTTRHKRHGKKYRIKIRRRKAAIHAQQDALNAALQTKEAAEREKRTQRNREKKVKKRMRDKAKKTEIANLEASSTLTTVPKEGPNDAQVAIKQAMR